MKKGRWIITLCLACVILAGLGLFFRHASAEDEKKEPPKTKYYSGEAIEGAVLQLIDKDGKVVKEWTTTKAATCTTNGSRKHVCQDCQHEETETIQSPGHQWGEWETITEPTCEGKGKRQHTCSVCGEVAEEDIPALDHDLEAIGGETQPAPGEAAVRVYTCKRCGETFLGFKADEPSEASLPHLMEGANGGMRFFGRPIGNALALKQATSLNTFSH